VDSGDIFKDFVVLLVKHAVKVEPRVILLDKHSWRQTHGNINRGLLAIQFFVLLHVSFPPIFAKSINGCQFALARPQVSAISLCAVREILPRIFTWSSIYADRSWDLNGYPEYDIYQKTSQLPPHRLAVLKRFFEDYKVLEHKEVIVGDILPANKALRVVEQSLASYRSRLGRRLRQIAERRHIKD
jgi:inorganic pyrophosphatase